ncbi:MAG: DUF4386 domain-containing protein [Chloroflexi bacterium]|nr:MAG: DUF4386 domain-containing protein [Chloroflexota bacterium]TMF35458.1 MAG: DUF4386 domain-containing protein [Chloroflexota bacterium]
MERIVGSSPAGWARLAGALYLIVFVGGFFALGFVPAATIVAGDPTATARSIEGHELLYRSGLAAHAVILVANVPLALLFYYLFHVVDRGIALLVAALVLVGTAVETATTFFGVAPLVALSSAQPSTALTSEQALMLVGLPLQVQSIGVAIALVFFGFYCLSVGYLVFASGFLPRTIGVLMTIGGLAYLVNSFANLLSPGFAAHLFPYVLLPSGIAEGSLCLWLLIAAVNVRRWHERAGAVLV